jgi:hypothetical protein
LFFHRYSRRSDLWSEVSFLLFRLRPKKKLNAISKETQKWWENTKIPFSRWNRKSARASFQYREKLAPTSFVIAREDQRN